MMLAKKRQIILHYHLFKNAGTSLDRILRQNFPGRWVTAEFAPLSGNNSALVAGWIMQNPQAIAFSTHTGSGPVPQIDGVDVISVLFLRDPISRIRSAYRFEVAQDADTWGSQLARTNDLNGYVNARLDREGDRQCRNFHTARLAEFVPGPQEELARAILALDALSVIGLVEKFDASMALLATALSELKHDFQAGPVHLNRSETGLADTLSDETLQRLVAANQDDTALLAVARARFGQTVPPV